MSDAYRPNYAYPQQLKQLLRRPYIPAPIGKLPRSDSDDKKDVPIYLRRIGNVHGGELLGTKGAVSSGASSSHYLSSNRPSSCGQGLYAAQIDIFRPFLGFRDLRIVSKEPKQPRKSPIVLCFVEFTSSQHASKAIEVLQGYKFNFANPNSPALKVQFARYRNSSATN